MGREIGAGAGSTTAADLGQGSFTAPVQAPDKLQPQVKKSPGSASCMLSDPGLTITMVLALDAVLESFRDTVLKLDMVLDPDVS